MTADTLQIDSVQLLAFKSDSRYDYDREIAGGNESLLEWIASIVNEWLNDVFGIVLDNDVTQYILIGLGLIVIIFLAWLYWRLRPKIFIGSESGDPLDYEVQEDTIYGVDFEHDIRQALTAHDYRQAVRLLYLQTLAELQDAGQIEWQASKTPVQYMRQVNNPAFTEMSRHFIRVRYGNFEASESLFENMKLLQAELRKGGQA
jgi:hypothetical protein